MALDPRGARGSYSAYVTAVKYKEVHRVAIAHRGVNECRVARRPWTDVMHARMTMSNDHDNSESSSQKLHSSVLARSRSQVHDSRLSVYALSFRRDVGCPARGRKIQSAYLLTDRVSVIDPESVL